MANESAAADNCYFDMLLVLLAVSGILFFASFFCPASYGHIPRYLALLFVALFGAILGIVIARGFVAEDELDDINNYRSRRTHED